ncbi:hypothetical protein PLESTF_000011700 [Pleodorina starrii]|nr:hypothetical protein PLESTF_000011700 [Pleodorina starrii]
MDEIQDGDLDLGEIEELVAEQEATAAATAAEGDVDIDALLDEVLDQAPDAAVGQDEDAAAVQTEAEAAAPAEADDVAPPGDDVQPQADGAAAAAADEGDTDDVLGEVAAAVAAGQGANLADAERETQQARRMWEAPDAVGADTAAAAEEPGAEVAAEAEAEAEAPAPAETDAAAADTQEQAAPGPSVKAAPVKGITVPKAPAIPAGRKGLLPPVRKTPAIGTKAAPPAPGKAPVTAAPAVKAAAGGKAVTGLAVKAAPAAKAAGGGAPAKPAAIGKPAAPAAPKSAAPKPAAAGAAKPAASSKPAAAPKTATTGAAAAAATKAPVAKGAATAKPAAAPAVKPAAAPAAKPAAAPAAKPKAAAAPKVIQARIVPDDGEEEGDVAACEKTKTAVAAPAAKDIKKGGKAGADAGGSADGGGGKKGAAGAAAAAAAAAKKRVVAVGSKASAAFELFKTEHKQKLIDEGMEAAEAAEQTTKDWAALGAEEKAEYEARAKEQAGDDAEEAAAAVPSKAKQPKAAKAPKAAPTEAGPKYYTNGYMLFLEERRPEIVASNPEASFTDVGKLLGAEWRGLAKDEQEEFNKRVKALNAESGAQPKPRKSKKKDEAAGEGAAAAGKKAAGKAAAAPKKAAGVAAKPAAKKATKKGSAADDDEADGLMDLAVAAADGMEIDGDGDDAGADAGPSGRGGKRPAGGGSRKRAGGGGGKKRRRSNDDCKADAEGEGAEAGAAVDSGDESDREDVDWETHPAEAILAKTADGRYLVKRVGLGLDEYGIVNARAVKRQRLIAAGAEQPEGEEAPPPLPVSIEMVDEFEAFQRSFQASVQDRSDGGDLDLDDLGAHSPLELCYYLGKLREDNMPLNLKSLGRRNKDISIRVPVLGLSMAVQRVMALERQRADDLAARLAEAEARLAQYEGGGAEGEVEAEADAAMEEAEVEA